MKLIKDKIIFYKYYFLLLFVWICIPLSGTRFKVGTEAGFSRNPGEFQEFSGFAPAATGKATEYGLPDPKDTSRADVKRILKDYKNFKTNKVKIPIWNQKLPTHPQKGYVLNNVELGKYKHLYGSLSTAITKGYEPNRVAWHTVLNAAFYANVVADNAVKRKCKSLLMKQIVHKNSNYKHSQWNKNLPYSHYYRGDLHPMFFTSDWMSNLLIIYLLVNDTMSYQEVVKFRNWAFNNASFVARHQNIHFSKYIPKRPELMGKKLYTFKNVKVNKGSLSKEAIDGKKLWSIYSMYNNRHAASAQFILLAGVILKKKELIDIGKQFFKEFLAFGVTPSGKFAESHRSVVRNPAKGLAYIGITLCNFAQSAYFLSCARGDNSMFTMNIDKRNLSSMAKLYRKYILGQVGSYVGGKKITDGGKNNRVVADKPLAYILEQQTKNSYYKHEYLRIGEWAKLKEGRPAPYGSVPYGFEMGGGMLVPSVQLFFEKGRFTKLLKNRIK